jgi:hypothetical protein
MDWLQLMKWLTKLDLTIQNISVGYLKSFIMKPQVSTLKGRILQSDNG